jgi:predicted RNA-binding Zn ribbon-like protein
MRAGPKHTGDARTMNTMAPARTRPLTPTSETVDATRTLAFVNTLSGRPTSAPVERLVSYQALVDWAREVGLLKAADCARLGARGRRRGHNSALVLQRARELRETLHEIFSFTSAGRSPAASTLAAASAQLSRWYPHGRLVPAGTALQWAYGGDDDLERPLWEIARAAARLLTSDRLERVRACVAADCGWWFLDDTRNHSRRWCDMNVCGNRDKVRRFRERQRE